MLLFYYFQRYSHINAIRYNQSYTYMSTTLNSNANLLIYIKYISLLIILFVYIIYPFR